MASLITQLTITFLAIHVTSTQNPQNLMRRVMRSGAPPPPSYAPDFEDGKYDYMDYIGLVQEEEAPATAPPTEAPRRAPRRRHRLYPSIQKAIDRQKRKQYERQEALAQEQEEAESFRPKVVDVKSIRRGDKMFTRYKLEVPVEVPVDRVKDNRQEEEEADTSHLKDVVLQYENKDEVEGQVAEAVDTEGHLIRKENAPEVPEAPTDQQEAAEGQEANGGDPNTHEEYGAEQAAQPEYQESQGQRVVKTPNELTPYELAQYQAAFPSTGNDPSAVQMAGTTYGQSMAGGNYGQAFASNVGNMGNPYQGMQSVPSYGVNPQHSMGGSSIMSNMQSPQYMGSPNVMSMMGNQGGYPVGQQQASGMTMGSMGSNGMPMGSMGSNGMPIGSMSMAQLMAQQGVQSTGRSIGQPQYMSGPISQPQYMSGTIGQPQYSQSQLNPGNPYDAGMMAGTGNGQIVGSQVVGG